MGHDKLNNVFSTNFSLMKHHHWSIEYLEQLMPWERYVYIQLLQEYIRDEELIAQQRQNELKAQMKASNMRR